MAPLGPGSLFAGYRIEALLGSGGMGAVYRARQLNLDREVALKVIAEPLAADPAFLERFRHEAVAAASLEHPNVVPVYEAGEVDGRLFAAMRLVLGGDLAGHLDREGALAPERAAGLVAQVAGALDAAHGAGIVHRDVKPANVLLTKAGATGHVYLCDFGVAKRIAVTAGVTQAGTVVGTPAYLAPEIVRGGTVSPAADVYALGCVLFEVLAGAPPFVRDDPLAVMLAHLSEPPPRVGERAGPIPEALEDVIARALRKDPAERFASAGELAAAARAALDAARPALDVTLAGSSAPPAASAAPAGATPIPTAATSLVGREAEIEAVCALLADDHARVVTLAGPGGMGKTRLALAVAQRIEDTFDDGAVVVELSAVRDPAQVLTTIGGQLQVAEHPGEDMATTLARTLAGLDLLLVLDNFEQVLPAGGDIARLLAGADAMKVLITSRAPLRIADEHVFDVPPLVHAEAARLFVARAREAHPEVELSPAAWRSIDDVCHTLEGMPLAIELAASRVRHLSISDLGERLEHRLAVLSRGRPDMAVRHQTLRAAIDASHELLDDQERAVFAALGVFVGGFTLAGAEAVCGPEVDALDALSSLIDNSLVRREHRRGHGRYSMLEVIREYALERLEACGGADVARERHAAYYLALAERLGPSLRFGAVDHESIDTILAEHGNLRTTMRRFQAAGEGLAMLRLAVALGPSWLPRLDRTEALQWVERGLELAPEAEPSLRAGALALRAGALVYTPDGNARAHADLVAALALCETGEAPELEFLILCGLSTVDSGLGYNDAVESWCRRALDLARRMQDPGRTGVALANLSNLFMIRGDFAPAAAYAEEAIEALSGSSDSDSLGAARINAGLALLHQGELAAATTHAHEGLRNVYESQDRESVTEALVLAAAVGAGGGAAERAAHVLAAAGALREGLGLDYQPIEARTFEQARASLEEGLGEHAFRSAWSDGRALTLEEAVALAFELTDPGRSSARSRTPAPADAPAPRAAEGGGA